MKAFLLAAGLLCGASVLHARECGSWLTVVEVYDDGVKLQMDAPTSMAKVVGYFYGISPYQQGATVQGYPPGSIPPEGWIIHGLGWLPDNRPWHFKLVRIGLTRDGKPFQIDCAEVDFVIPGG